MADAFCRAVVYLGGVTATARELGVSRTAIQEWQKDGVPPRRVLGLEAVLELKRREYESLTTVPVTRHDLRPDIYPE